MANNILTTKEIFELERKHVEQKIAYDLKKAEHENKQQLINTTTEIAMAHMKFNTLGLFYLALRGD